MGGQLGGARILDTDTGRNQRVYAHETGCSQYCDRELSCEARSDRKLLMWKELGLYFENLHLYKVLPGDDALLQRTRTSCEKLQKIRSLGKDNSSKEARFVLAITKAIDGWTAA